MSWQWVDNGEYVEVLPLTDDREHLAGDECWCDPKIEQEGDARPVITHHHSFDIRLTNMLEGETK